MQKQSYQGRCCTTQIWSTALLNAFFQHGHLLLKLSLLTIGLTASYSPAPTNRCSQQAQCLVQQSHRKHRSHISSAFKLLLVAHFADLPFKRSDANRMARSRRVVARQTCQCGQPSRLALLMPSCCGKQAAGLQHEIGPGLSPRMSYQPICTALTIRSIVTAA